MNGQRIIRMCLAAGSLTLAVSPSVTLATTVPALRGVYLQTSGHGKTRGGGIPIKIVVKENGKPASGAAVTMDGSGGTLTGTADDQGVAPFTLMPGAYTAKAVNTDGTVTRKLSILTKTKSHIYTLTIVPATPSAATAATPQ